jgi:hypothetical protein
MPTQQNFLEILKNPYDLDKNTLLYLETMTKTYPYCQSLQIMLAKNLQQTDKLAFEKQVNKASAYTTDRRKFQRYISDRDRSLAKPVEIRSVQQPPAERSMTLLEIVKKRLAEIRSKHSAPVAETTTVVIKTEKVPSVADTTVQDIAVHPQTPIFQKSKDTDTSRREIDFATGNFSDTQPPETIPAEIEITSQLSSNGNEKSTPEQIETLKIENRPVNSAPSLDQKSVSNNSLPQLDKTVREIPRILSHNDSFPYPVTRKQAARTDINYLIDKFLKEEPRIKAKRELPERQTDLSEDSTREHPQLVSETLAAVYMKQGNKEKALDVYEKLCLKFPEKSSYFAQKIIAIKNDIN